MTETLTRNAAGRAYSEPTLSLALEGWYNVRQLKKHFDLSFGRALKVYENLPLNARIVEKADGRCNLHGVLMKDHENGQSYALAVLKAIHEGEPALKKGESLIRADEAYKRAKAEHSQVVAAASM